MSNYLDKFFRLLQTKPIWVCSKCGYKFDGLEIAAFGNLCGDPNRWREVDHHCPKCKTVDPPFQKRTYGRSIKRSGGDGYWSFDDVEKNPWWSKRNPLWSIKKGD